MQSEAAHVTLHLPKADVSCCPVTYTGREELGGMVGLLECVEGASELVGAQLSIHAEDVLMLSTDHCGCRVTKMGVV